jgi:Mor family transcriptional regulator
MAAKRRNRRGEQHHRAKLTESDVRTIRISHDAGRVTAAELARRYQMAESSIRSVVHRQSWRDID